jgi:hypothetical protein
MLRTEEISMGLDQIFVPPGTKKLSGSLVNSPPRNISHQFKINCANMALCIADSDE